MTVAPKEQAKKLELWSVQELARKWSSVGRLLRHIQENFVDEDTWKEIEDEFELDYHTMELAIVCFDDEGLQGFRDIPIGMVLNKVA